MNIPTDLKYTKTHEWVKFLNETTVQIGLTDFAQHSMGDLVFVNLPEAGEAVVSGERMADVESVKAVSDVFSPVTGTISATSDELPDAPQNINQSPYDAWFVEVSQVSGTVDLLTSAEYQAFCEEGE